MASTDLQLADRHRYVTAPGRKPGPGVTTIIGNLSKDGLKWWSARITAEIATLEDRTIFDDRAYIEWLRRQFNDRTGSDLGTRVHDHALSWAQGREISPLADEEGFIDALSKFYADHDPQWIVAERVLVNAELDYGGRMDAIGELPERGVTLVDYKTGGIYLESVALQLEAYEHCELAVYGDDGMLAKSEPLPKIDSHAVVYLHADGTYRLVDVPADPLAWPIFCHLREVHSWRKEIEKLQKEIKR